MVLSLAYHKHGDMVRSCHEKYVLMDVELGREVRDSCLATQAIFSMHFDAFLVSISFTFFHVLLIFSEAVQAGSDRFNPDLCFLIFYCV
jgi:hypothetical protein